ncbi:MAG: hypothetical protein PHS92_02625 [Candidatus Gracilibacteria bacterium]|nr:hypothetical protein [Candidatus Gracilibacteria bacterium]
MYGTRQNLADSAYHGGNETLLNIFNFEFRGNIKEELLMFNSFAIFNESGLNNKISRLSRNKYHKNLWNKVDSISDAISSLYVNKVDPIDYLMFQYFHKKLSLQDISGMLERLGVEDIDSDDLRYLMNRHFGWKLRDRHDFQGEAIRKISISMAKVGKTSKEKTIEKTKNHLEFIIADFDSGINGDEDLLRFDLDKFTSFRNHQQRLAYILMLYNKISDPSEAKQYMKSLTDAGIGLRVIANALREKTIRTFNVNGLDPEKVPKFDLNHIIWILDGKM